jgi:hypothetical protein
LSRRGGSSGGRDRAGLWTPSTRGSDESEAL